MNDPAEPLPPDLGKSQIASLRSCARQAAGYDPGHIRTLVATHVDNARTAYQRNRIVNLRLAVALGAVLEAVLAKWAELSGERRYWLAGAAIYFADCDDDEPDFDSPIGFEDDAEILNACLRFSALDELCLNVEDYDDA